MVLRETAEQGTGREDGGGRANPGREVRSLCTAAAEPCAPVQTKELENAVEENNFEQPSGAAIAEGYGPPIARGKQPEGLS